MTPCLSSAPFLPLAALALVLAATPAGAQGEMQWSNWHAIGPFDHTVGQEFENPFERELRRMTLNGPGPDYDKKVQGKKRTRLEWVELAPEHSTQTGYVDHWIDLNGVVPPLDKVKDWNANAVVFLHRTVDADEDTTWSVRFGSDDGVFVWCNGALVHRKDVTRGNTLDATIDLELLQGTNHLLVAVTQAGGGWTLRTAEPTKAVEGDTDEAIARGVRFLLDHQLADGSFGNHENYGGGSAAFCAYALLKCGLANNHPAVLRALEYARARPVHYTYTIATEILALSAQKDPANREWLLRRTKELIEIQSRSGLFGYPVHPDGSTPPDDMSATIFAAMALDAAAHQDIEVSEDVWRDLIEGTLRCAGREEDFVEPDGTKSKSTGFKYRVGDGHPTGSMTTAGIATLVLAKRNLGRKLPKRVEREVDAAIRYATNWLGAHLTFSENPGNPGWHYYSIYGIERVGSLLETETLGETDWYRKGAAYLVSEQAADGSWSGSEGRPLATPLALLFLRRATQPESGKGSSRSSVVAESAETSPVRIQVQGDTPITAFVLGFSDRARERYAWPSDDDLHVTRVEYVAHDLDGDGAPITLATVDADGRDGVGTARFPMRAELPHNGNWELRTRVHLLDPPDEAGVSERSVLDAEPLAVRIDAVLDPEVLAYGADGIRNVVRDIEVVAEASSEPGEGRAAPKSVDGSNESYWECRAQDATPWIRLTLERAAAASTLRLVHAQPRNAERGRARATRVRVILNGDLAGSSEHELEDDPKRKGSIPLPQGELVRTLEIRVLAAGGRALGTTGVGFAEIELLP